MSDARLVPCPFVTYERAKTPPNRKKYAELVKWRGETHLYLPRLFPLLREAVSADSDRSREFTFTLVRLSDNKEFTSAPIPVGKDFPSAVWGDDDQSARFVVQFDDGEKFDEPVGRRDYNERRRYRALRHVYFELDADTRVLTNVDETSENDGAKDQRRSGRADGVLRGGYTYGWKHGVMLFEGDTVYFGALREDTPLFQNFAEWIENPQPKYEGHDTETGWKRQEQTAGQFRPKDKYQYVCVLEFDGYQRGIIDEKKDYIMFEDENKIRVLDLEVMYEIVRMKETLRESARFSNRMRGARFTKPTRRVTADGRLRGLAMRFFDTHWHPSVDDLLSKYSGARKACFLANVKRLLGNSLPSSMALLKPARAPRANLFPNLRL